MHHHWEIAEINIFFSQAYRAPHDTGAPTPPRVPASLLQQGGGVPHKIQHTITAQDTADGCNLRPSSRTHIGLYATPNFLRR